jgi:competence protein ComEC
MIWYYHLVTLVSLVANLVVVPIAFFVLAGALLSLAAAPFSGWLSLVFNNANWALTKIILGVVSLFAEVPCGHFYVERPHRPSGVVLEINALDLRSGAAVHLRTRGMDWLVDAGPARDYERVLFPYLRSRGVNRLDGLVLTHGDAGHLGGAPGLIPDFKPREIAITTAPDRSALHRNFLELLSARGRPPRVCHAGDELTLSGEVRARVLFPPANFKADRADDQALVVQLVVSGKPQVLLMSDSGENTERILLQNYPDLRCEILIKGQHHTGISGTPAFLDRVRPQAIVATSRDFPESERLKPEWLEEVRRRGIKLFRQDETGALQIRLFPGRWEATGHVTGDTFRNASR